MARLREDREAGRHPQAAGAGGAGQHLLYRPELPRARAGDRCIAAEKPGDFHETHHCAQPPGAGYSAARLLEILAADLRGVEEVLGSLPNRRERLAGSQARLWL